MIKNIIFDMGGVVFDDSASNLMQIFPNRNEEEINQIINMAFGRNFDKCDTGEKSISELISELKMKPGYEDAIYLLNPDHYNITFPIKMDVLEYIIDLKSRGYKLYILSNTSKNFSISSFVVILDRLILIVDDALSLSLYKLKTA